MSKYFGTDGFRGEVNKVLTVEHAFKIGRFLGWYYGRDHKASIAIGKDTRRSGYMLEHALIAALQKWRTLLLHADVTAYTDHRALQYLLNIKGKKAARAREAR